MYYLVYCNCDGVAFSLQDLVVPCLHVCIHSNLLSGFPLETVLCQLAEYYKFSLLLMYNYSINYNTTKCSYHCSTDREFPNLIGTYVLSECIPSSLYWLPHLNITCFMGCCTVFGRCIG